MSNVFKDMLKICIEIPYDDYTIYPTVSITKNAIANYCSMKNIKYEFSENNVNDNMQVKLDGKSYEILRLNGGRGGYGIQCRPL